MIGKYRLYYEICKTIAQAMRESQETRLKILIIAPNRISIMKNEMPTRHLHADTAARTVGFSSNVRLVVLRFS
jgi:hypothetical protein